MKSKSPIAEVIAYLEGKEWSMGNGQCGECHGLGPKFYGHHEAKELGHRRSCKLAKSLFDLGAHPIYKGKFPKTPEGEAFVARCKDHWKAMFKNHPPLPDITATYWKERLDCPHRKDNSP